MSNALSQAEIAARIEAEGVVTADEFVHTVSALDIATSIRENVPGAEYAYAVGMLARAVEADFNVADDPGNFLLNVLADIVNRAD